MPLIENLPGEGSHENPTQPPAPENVVEALDQIDRLLHQMLLLAELSASSANVDREQLQIVLERLRRRIDRIADTIGQE